MINYNGNVAINCSKYNQPLVSHCVTK